MAGRGAGKRDRRGGWSPRDDEGLAALRLAGVSPREIAWALDQPLERVAAKIEALEETGAGDDGDA